MARCRPSLVATLVALAAACNQSGFRGPWSSGEGSSGGGGLGEGRSGKTTEQTSGDDELPAREESAPRPTDSTEGVQGYLTDPKLVRAEAIPGSDEVRVTGATGAVRWTGDDGSDLILAVWAMPSAKFRASGFPGGTLTADVENLACGAPNPDGGFDLKTKPRERNLLVTVGTACDARQVVIEAQTAQLKAVYQPSLASTAFAAPAAHFESICICPEGQVYYDHIGHCATRVAECSLAEGNDGPVCGCDGQTYKTVCEVIEARRISWEHGACP